MFDYQAFLDAEDYAYDEGWQDMMWRAVNWYRYKKDYAYAEGVDDADEYLYYKYKDESYMYGRWAA